MHMEKDKLLGFYTMKLQQVSQGLICPFDENDALLPPDDLPQLHVGIGRSSHNSPLPVINNMYEMMD